MVPAAGHSAPEDGYCLPVEEPGRLAELLEREAPEIVISSVRGDFGQVPHLPCQRNIHRIPLPGVMRLPAPAVLFQHPDSETVFEIEEAGGEVYQAVLPGREDIPEELQMTVAQVLESLRGGRR